MLQSSLCQKRAAAMRTKEHKGVVSFWSIQYKMFWSHALLKVSSKRTVSSDQISLTESKANLLVKTVIPCETVRQKHFSGKNCKKILQDSGRAAKVRSSTVLKIDSALYYLCNFWNPSELPFRWHLQPTTPIIM